MLFVYIAVVVVVVVVVVVFCLALPPQQLPLQSVFCALLYLNAWILKISK